MIKLCLNDRIKIYPYLPQKIIASRPSNKFHTHRMYFASFGRRVKIFHNFKISALIYLKCVTCFMGQNFHIIRCPIPVSYTHLRAHETPEHLVCRLLLEKKKKT